MKIQITFIFFNFQDQDSSVILLNNSTVPRVSLNQTKLSIGNDFSNEKMIRYYKDLPLYLTSHFPMYGTKNFGNKTYNELFVSRETTAYLIR